MRAERSVLALIDDLEQQAEGVYLVERDLEVADRSRAEYARVSLASRLHATTGRTVRLVLLGGVVVSGVVARSGPDWLLVEDAPGHEWVVPHEALGLVQGASGRAVSQDALGVLRRLPLRAILRRLADEESDVLLHLRDGTRLEARLLRLGADFAEVRAAGTRPVEGYDVVPLVALAAVQRRD